MKRFIISALACVYATTALAQVNCPADPRCLNNPYGAGNPYKGDGLMNPYSEHGSRYSDKSWTNPNANNTPRIYDNQGNYRGKLSNNPNDPDSISNPYGQYGSSTSPDSINNPYGAGNPYNGPLSVSSSSPAATAAADRLYSQQVDPYITPEQALLATAVVVGAVLITWVVKSIWTGVSESIAAYNKKPKPEVMSLEEKRNWGQYYLYAPADRRDFSKAKQLLLEAANSEDAQAQFSLGLIYRDGHGVPANSTEAFNWFKRAADNGDGSSALLVGNYYNNGHVIGRNREKAIEYYIKSSEKNNPWAQFVLGRAYLKGEGVEKNPSKAFDYFKKSADNHLALGLTQVGLAYQTGNGVEKNAAKAFEYFKIASDKNDILAKYKLGEAYLRGYGVALNNEEAIKHLTAVVESNHPNAMSFAGYELGGLYEKEAQSDEINQKVIMYYQWAAERNNYFAAYRLAHLYEAGLRVKQDLAAAAQWYKVAAELGAPGANIKSLMLERAL